MEPMILRPRKAAVEEPLESWDDDDLEIGGDDFTLRAASLATTTTSSHHRDSVSSRWSARSDVDGDEEKQVHVPGDDQGSTNDAIATAKRAGIPIPQNVPASALMGGTIKRLGGKKLKKIVQDDWDDGDLELPGDAGLTIKRQDAANFPDALRQVSAGSTHASPVKPLQAAPKFDLSPRPELKPKKASSNLMLDRFRDEEDDDFFGDGRETIKVPKSRLAPTRLPLITPPTPLKSDAAADEDFEGDLQLPSDNGPLRLSIRRDTPKTPASIHDDTDEWGEGGSLGTRHGGTKRDRNSHRSSSTTALSPSVTSSLTIESEDEGLDGLVLPNGPIHFDDILKRRQQDRSPDHLSSEKQAAKRVEVKEDFLTGLEIGDGDVFDSSKLTLNRNIKMKATRQTSPTRPKTAVSLTFTNKPTPALSASNSRLPRPPGGHERQSSALEPVSESGGPILRSNRRSQSRLGGHSSQSSIASVGTPTTPSMPHPSIPSTPRRRELGGQSSVSALRKETTTTNAQLLKLKRSMPTMRSFPQSPAKLPMGSRFERPPSRTDPSRTNMMSRPKTPVERDRSGAESSMSHARKNRLPFLPAGSSSSQSQHVTIKTTRHFRRNDSESSNTSIELRPSSRAVSRSTIRSPSPRRPRGAEALAREAAPKRTMTKPVRRRHFGEGFELDGFDDLPTSKDVEQKFVKEPIGRGPPKISGLRNKIALDAPPLRTTTPAPLRPYSPMKSRDDMPRFARDTNASRIAREHSIANRAPSAQGAPLATLPNQWKAKVSATTGLSNVHAQPVKPKKTKAPSKKPQLIKPLGNLDKPKSVKGMYYNPYTYRWEGNENELTQFDVPAPSPSAASIIFREKEQQVYREKENATPRPALIQNVNSSHNVQVVGGMVFDPQRMCWLKMPSQPPNGKSTRSGTMDGFDALDDEEDDVFKDVPDLEDNPTKEADEVGGRKSDGASTLKDDWLVGEEFDVGPEFVKRQREEEERWRRKCEKWVGASLNRGTDDWRWSIRDVVN